MVKRIESDFAELIVERGILENFANERSAYYGDFKRAFSPAEVKKLHQKLQWHIGRSLSDRQRQVMKMVLRGFKEREIAEKLGVAQQVVNIYKWRAIKKLQKLLVQ